MRYALVHYSGMQSGKVDLLNRRCRTQVSVHSTSQAVRWTTSPLTQKQGI